MQNIDFYVSYTITVFVVVLVSACIVNLLKQHFLFQLTGIAFFFTVFIGKTLYLITTTRHISIESVLLESLPFFSGISACLVGMVIGFWIFPVIRRKFRD